MQPFHKGILIGAITTAATVLVGVYVIAQIAWRKAGMPLLLLVLLTGCTPKPSPYAGGVGQGAAKARTSVAHAAWNVEKARPYTDNTGKAYLDGAQQSHIIAHQGIDEEVNNSEKLRKDYWTIFRKLNDWPAKYIGWKNWDNIRIIAAVWAGVGILGIVLHFTGFAAIGSFIMRFLPFSNPFAFLRDRIERSRVDVVVTTETSTKEVESPTESSSATMKRETTRPTKEARK